MTFSPRECTLSSAALLFTPTDVPTSALFDGASQGSDHLDVALRAMGRGVGSELILSPNTVLALGGTPLGVRTEQTLTLSNPNTSARRWRWLPEGPPDGSSGATALGVDVSPREGEIGGGESLDLAVTLVGSDAGDLERTLLFGCWPHGRTLQLPVTLRASGPCLSLAEPRRLDFGLVPLGESAELTLAFTNESGTPAKWMVAPGPLPRTEVARVAARAQNGALGLAGAANSCVHLGDFVCSSRRVLLFVSANYPRPRRGRRGGRRSARVGLGPLHGRGGGVGRAGC